MLGMVGTLWKVRQEVQSNCPDIESIALEQQPPKAQLQGRI